MAHSIHVGQKFEDYQAFESAIERYQRTESVQFYKRDSRTVQKAQPRVQKIKRTYKVLRKKKNHVTIIAEDMDFGLRVFFFQKWTLRLLLCIIYGYLVI